MRPRTSIFLLAAACLVIETGCNFAPKYTRPAIETAPQFKELTPDQAKQIGNWQLAAPNENALRGNWWELFRDDQLNTLEKQVELSNQTLAAAVARFESARAL